jgi:hypothetical protein
MSRVGLTPLLRRRIVIAATFCVVLGGLIVSAAKRVEFWPFSSYSMFSGYCPDHFQRLAFFGVTPAGAEVNLPNDRYWQPWPEARLSEGLGQFLHRPERSPEATNRVMEHFANQYVAGQRTRRHDGPDIVELRLYLVDWQLRADLANRDRPEKMELVTSRRIQR